LLRGVLVAPFAGVPMNRDQSFPQKGPTVLSVALFILIGIAGGWAWDHGFVARHAESVEVTKCTMMDLRACNGTPIDETALEKDSPTLAGNIRFLNSKRFAISVSRIRENSLILFNLLGFTGFNPFLNTGGATPGIVSGTFAIQFKDRIFGAAARYGRAPTVTPRDLKTEIGSRLFSGVPVSNRDIQRQIIEVMNRCPEWSNPCAGGRFDPLLVALLKKIPEAEKGWPAAQRVRWFRTFAMNVSQIYDGDDEPVEMKIELEKEAAN
jgi:hypothetical protein